MLRAAGSFEVDYAELAPQHTRAFRDCFVDDLRDELRAAEYVDYLDRRGNRCEVGVAFFAESCAERVVP